MQFAGHWEKEETETKQEGCTGAKHYRMERSRRKSGNMSKLWANSDKKAATRSWGWSTRTWTVIHKTNHCEDAWKGGKDEGETHGLETERRADQHFIREFSLSVNTRGEGERIARPGVRKWESHPTARGKDSGGGWCGSKQERSCPSCCKVGELSLIFIIVLF